MPSRVEFTRLFWRTHLNFVRGLALQPRDSSGEARRLCSFAGSKVKFVCHFLNWGDRAITSVFWEIYRLPSEVEKLLMIFLAVSLRPYLSLSPPPLSLFHSLSLSPLLSTAYRPLSLSPSPSNSLVCRDSQEVCRSSRRAYSARNSHQRPH